MTGVSDAIGEAAREIAAAKADLDSALRYASDKGLTVEDDGSVSWFDANPLEWIGDENAADEAAKLIGEAVLRASAADGRLTAHLKRAQRIAVNDPNFPQADYRPYGTEKPTDHDQDVFSDAHALPAGADLKEWDNDEDVSVDYYYALNNFQFRVTGESVIVDGEEQTVYDVEVAKRYNFAANPGEHPRNDFRAPIRAVTLRWASGRRSRSTSWPSRRRHGGRGSR